MRHPSFVFVTLLTLFVVTWCNLSQSQDPGTGSGINVTTWQNDVGRTGQNLAEGTITYNNIGTSNFGQLCSVALDGQVFAQPLVELQARRHECGDEILDSHSGERPRLRCYAVG